MDELFLIRTRKKEEKKKVWKTFLQNNFFQKKKVLSELNDNLLEITENLYAHRLSMLTGTLKSE